MAITNILLIDDDSGVLFALKLLLEVLQFKAETCQNGEKAVELLRTGPLPDLVICDLKMPGMDGMAVLKATREFLPDIRFLLMSGHATNEEIAVAKSLGASGFLAKPFTPEQFQAAIAKL